MLGLQSLETRQAENEPHLAQNFERQPGATAERAGNLKGFLLVAPPAFHGRNGRVEAAAAQHRGANSETRSQRWVARPAPDQPLDADLEPVDDGRLVERRADFRQRNVERRLPFSPRYGGGVASTLAVTLFAPAVWHGAFVTVIETQVKGM